jgi:hypothetical protein
MQTATTQKELSAGLQAIKAIADAIKELGSVPSGHLYAQVMNHLSLQAYEKIILILVNGGLVENTGNLLTWKGPR